MIGSRHRAAGGRPLSVIWCSGPVSFRPRRGRVPGVSSRQRRFRTDHIRSACPAIAAGQGPQRWLIALGYVGWSAGQLENEIGHNAWLTVDADAGTLFDLPPEGRMTGALGLLGIDLSRLSEQVGHA